MPVIDGEFIPNMPLALAEQQVDYLRLNAQILRYRERVERAASGAARRAALQIAEFGSAAPAVERTLALRLERQLAGAARFGARETVREIRRLRAGRPAVGYSVPDAGRFGRLARLGVDGVLSLISFRARSSAHAVIEAAAAAAAAVEQDDTLVRAAAAAAAAARILHNHVLELVGETINLGRAAGALTMDTPPQFAMRSEQLDRRTCGPCDALHGEIAAVDTPEFYDLLPPNGCLGGGRCRGVMVFGDGPADVRAPAPTEQELQDLRRQREPRRRAA